MFYPLGFIVVILGRAQLFTENTLYPVALVLAEKKHFWNTMRLWFTVLPSNVLGALAFAALAGRTSALHPDVVHALTQLGMEAVHRSPGDDLLERGDGRVDHCDGGVAGLGVALDHGVGDDYLDADVSWSVWATLRIALRRAGDL